MSTSAPTSAPPARRPGESALIRRLLIGVSVLIVALVLVLPLTVVFYEGLRAGWTAYWDQVTHPRTWTAVKLSLLTAAFAVPLNTLFGVAAAWCITRFRFRGQSTLLTLIDLPFAMSPVIAGLSLWLLFGPRGWFGDWVGQTYELTVPLLGVYEITPKVVFALPGIVLATVFITFPFVARELIPLMQSQGSDEEQAAISLGGRGWTIFWRVTLPNIKWGLLYGIILCNARAIGEFGAVFVVSNGTASQQTLSLRIERLYYESVVSVVPVFAVASLLAFVGVSTLLVKAFIERHYKDELEATDGK